MRFLLLLSVLLFANCADLMQKTIYIPRSKIQESLEAKFPIDKNMVVMRHTLSNPGIYFDGDMIGIKFNYKASALEKNLDADINIKARIEYRQKKKSFFLTGFEVVEAKTNEINFTPSSSLSNALKNIFDNYIAKYPVYSLDQKDFKHDLAKMLLRDLTVEGDSLAILLSL